MTRRRPHIGEVGILLAVASFGPACVDEPEQPASVESLAEVLADCRSVTDDPAGCDGIIYVWSKAMPLSVAGLGVIRRVAEHQGISSVALHAADLRRAAQGRSGGRNAGAAQLARDLIARGATIHYPSAVLYRDGHLAPSALLGFKSEAGYAAGISRFVKDWAPDHGSSPSVDRFVDVKPYVTDVRISGTPGAYFRAVRNRALIAFELRQQIYFLDLNTGTVARGPGRLDFIPSPDGRLFATPHNDPAGLAFYSAAKLFARLAEGTASSVEPAFVDIAMRDQYPSIGVLRGEVGSVVTYRVLTAWMAGIAFRDYAVKHSADGNLHLRPVGPVIPACPGHVLSLPIIAPSGRELAARDEATGTTAIFDLEDDGSCTKELDLALPTGKVAWHDSGDLIAFSIPHGVVRDGKKVLWTNTAAEEWAGVFTYDRSEQLFSRIAGSESAEGLVFPEFADSSSIIFLFFREGDESPRFRRVCCVD